MGVLTVGAATRAAAERLTAAGIDGARLDARLLAAEVLAIEPLRVAAYPETPLSPGQAARFEHLVARREAREPMSHILGRRGFWTLTLKVTADTLDPRGDTETVVEAVLEALGDRSRPWRILDLGTGTGAILLALLSELPHATGLGVDISSAALAVAQENADTNGLSRRAEFRLGEWGRGLDGCFHAIVSNPPYIPDQEIDGLEPEVARYEPRLALAGGADGLDCYRALIPALPDLLCPCGVTALEVGAGQAEAVAEMMRRTGLEVAELRPDLGGIPRCVAARRL